MITTSFEMLMNASCAAFIFGACVGIIYSFFTFIFDLVRHKRRGAYYRINNDANVGVGQNVFDFFFALLSGILYLILTYVFMDGANNFSPICLFFLAFFVIRRIIYSIVAKILRPNE